MKDFIFTYNALKRDAMTESQYKADGFVCFVPDTTPRCRDTDTGRLMKRRYMTHGHLLCNAAPLCGIRT